jgi:hypothetical protein
VYRNSKSGVILSKMKYFFYRLKSSLFLLSKK